MNCEFAHEQIVMAVYEELANEQKRELEWHMAGCLECHKERTELLALRVLADAHPIVEPDANLVARSRLKLEDALDALPPPRWYERLSQRLMNNYASLQAAPLAACLLLVAGVGAGSLSGYEFARSHAAHSAVMQTAQATAGQAQPAPMMYVQQVSMQAAAVAAPAEIANISSIVRQPNSRKVEVRYNRSVPQRIAGSLDDPAIQQLLVQASENSASDRVRDNSVDLLAAECRFGHDCQATGIRDALLEALLYDSNAGVRRKALQGLEPYVANDMQVRNAVLETLMNDGDPRIRTAAINILEPVEADTSVRQVLYTVSNSDQNPNIRNVSREVLNNVPEIQ